MDKKDKIIVILSLLIILVGIGGMLGIPKNVAAVMEDSNPPKNNSEGGLVEPIPNEGNNMEGSDNVNNDNTDITKNKTVTLPDKSNGVTDDPGYDPYIPSQDNPHGISV